MKIGRNLCVFVFAIVIASCASAWFVVRGNTSEIGKLSSFASSRPNLQTSVPKISVNGTKPPGGDFQVPPNATLLPPAPTMSFSLALNCRNVTIQRGKSSTIMLTVNNVDGLNATFRATLSDSPIVRMLPLNTTIDFGKMTLVAAPNSVSNIAMTISVGNTAVPGTYSLVISAEQRVGMWTFDDSVPLELAIAS